MTTICNYVGCDKVLIDRPYNTCVVHTPELIAGQCENCGSDYRFKAVLDEAFKLKNGKYGKRISKVAGASKESGETIPTIQLDEPASETDSPSLDGAEEIRPENIPF
jgi:hypothetical protein